LWAIENALGREIVIPKIPSYNILALASAIAPEAEFIEVGIRPGEKIHEELITVSDSYNTIDVGQYYIILPPNINKTKYLEHYGGTEIQKGFSYNSRDNENRLLVDDIRKLLIYQFEQDIAQ